MVRFRSMKRMRVKMIKMGMRKRMKRKMGMAVMGLMRNEIIGVVVKFASIQGVGKIIVIVVV